MIRNFFRLISIFRAFARHGALFPATLRSFSPTLAFFARLVSSKDQTAREGERLAAALQELGPTFIKLGQMLSTRPDLVGVAIATDLSLLQDRLPPFSTEEAKAIITESLGRPVASLFVDFTDVPVAAASIAQVHFATVRRDDGTLCDVAVKVLRAGIEHQFQRDVNLFYALARGGEWLFPSLKRFRLPEVVALFEGITRQEMDLLMEAAAAAELASNFKDDKTFKVPAVDWDRTSHRVLTLERVRGIPIDEVARLNAAGFSTDKLLVHAANSFFYQVFRDGFFHADLHPGNLFVNEEGTLAPVDFGIMGRLDMQTRAYLADMLLGFLQGDYRRVADVHFDAGYVPANQDRDRFTQAMRAIGEPLLNKPLHQISIARLLADLFAVTRQFQMQTQPQLLLLQKTMLMAEGIGRILNPSVNMWELPRPLIEAWIRRHRGPVARLTAHVKRVERTLERLPLLLDRVDAVLVKAEQGGPQKSRAGVFFVAGMGVAAAVFAMWELWG